MKHFVSRYEKQSLTVIDNYVQRVHQVSFQKNCSYATAFEVVEEEYRSRNHAARFSSYGSFRVVKHRYQKRQARLRIIRRQRQKPVNALF